MTTDMFRTVCATKPCRGTKGPCVANAIAADDVLETRPAALMAGPSSNMSADDQESIGEQGTMNDATDDTYCTRPLCTFFHGLSLISVPRHVLLLFPSRYRMQFCIFHKPPVHPTPPPHNLKPIFAFAFTSTFVCGRKHLENCHKAMLASERAVDVADLVSF